MKLLKLLASLSPRVEVRLIPNMTRDLRGPARSNQFQALLEAHKHRRAQECRKVKSRKVPLAVPDFDSRSLSGPTGLEQLLTAPSLLLRQAD